MVADPLAFAYQFRFFSLQSVLTALVLTNAVIDGIDNSKNEKSSDKCEQRDHTAKDGKKGRVDSGRDGPIGELAALFDRVADNDHHLVDKGRNSYQPTGRIKLLTVEKRIASQNRRKSFK